MLRCPRGAIAPEFLKMASLPQKRGDGTPGDATVLRFARLLAKAWRPPTRRPAFSFGVGPRFSFQRCSLAVVPAVRRPLVSSH
jgi:hypothetical protein